MKIKVLSPESIAKLIPYNWPGNIRELENTMHRAVLLSKDDIIEPEDLMLKNTRFIGQTLESVEQETISQTLKHCLGDYNMAAAILGISISKLQQKLDKLPNYEEVK